MNITKAANMKLYIHLLKDVYEVTVENLYFHNISGYKFNCNLIPVTQ